jgi:hypothetical protein
VVVKKYDIENMKFKVKNAWSLIDRVPAPGFARRRVRAPRRRFPFHHSFFHKAKTTNLPIVSLLESYGIIFTALAIVNNPKNRQTSADGSVIAPRIARTSVR